MLQFRHKPHTRGVWPNGSRSSFSHSIHSNNADVQYTTLHVPVHCMFIIWPSVTVQRCQEHTSQLRSSHNMCFTTCREHPLPSHTKQTAWTSSRNYTEHIIEQIHSYSKVYQRERFHGDTDGNEHETCDSPLATRLALISQDDSYFGHSHEIA